MLKKLFYAIGSILMLALAYHLGVQNATAQSNLIDTGDVLSYTAAIGHTFYGGGGPIPAPVPGTGRIVATGLSSRNYYTAMLDNGDVYWWNFEPSVLAWQYQGNVLGLPTTAQHSTWGQLKARYRK